MHSQTETAAIFEAVQLHAATKSYDEIGALLGLTASAVGNVARKAGFKKPHIFVGLRAQQARQREVILEHAGTHTLEQMGRMLGVTRERVRQLCQKWQIKRKNILFLKLRPVSDGELSKRVRQPEKFLNAIARELGVLGETLKLELSRRGIKCFTRREYRASLLAAGMRLCSSCRKVKPLAQFYRNADNEKGYSYHCKECASARACAWWKQNEVSRRNRPTATWEGMFKVFSLFHQTHGHCNVPLSSNSGSLSRWLGRQRLDYRAGHLLPERKALLESLGFDPSGLGARLEARWEARFSQLADFKELHGHCRVTRRIEGDAPLVGWLKEQRKMAKRGRMSPERLRRLLEIGMEHGRKLSDQ